MRLLAILQKEFLQMRRDRMTLAIMLVLPIVQILIFGFAIHTNVKHQSTVVFDQSLTEESRELLAGFTASGYFDINYTARSFAEVESAISSGRAHVGIIIPPDFTRDLRHGSGTQVQVIVDAADSTSSTIAIAAAQSIGERRSRAYLLERHPELSAVNLTPYEMRVRAWYNPDAITAWYMLPGIMGIIITMTMVMITSMAIVRERERGTLEQLIVTPLKTWELLLGKIIPYILVGYVQMTIALMTSLAVFSVPLRGSLALLYALTTLFIISSLTMGIMISTFARTQMQAMLMSFVVFLPSVLLSGFVFPRESMPDFFYYFSGLFPMTYFVDILRGIFLKGCTLSDLTTQTAALLIFIALTFGLSLKKFSRIMN